ncbi:MAG: SH3 domain-containing protein [Ruminococcus sp.]|nr:SH3 domain-containing protein [Ruminococcus sp.]
MNKDKQRRGGLFSSPNAVNIITLLAATLAVVLLVLFLAKKLVASNNSDVPAGLNTATLAVSGQTTVTTVTTAVTTAQSSSVSQSGAGSVSDTSAGTTATQYEQADDIAYVVTYVQLKAQPDPDSANVICMSPNVKVKVLERRTDGYIQLTFLNGDGTNITGYVKTEYLSPAPVERTTAAQTEAPEETLAQAPADTTAATTKEQPAPLIETQATTAAGE